VRTKVLQDLAQAFIK